MSITKRAKDNHAKLLEPTEETLERYSLGVQYQVAPSVKLALEESGYVFV